MTFPKDTLIIFDWDAVRAAKVHFWPLHLHSTPGSFARFTALTSGARSAHLCSSVFVYNSGIDYVTGYFECGSF